jgi:hypothetical protein
VGAAVNIPRGVLWATIKRLLCRHGCPPQIDDYATATGFILRQADVIAEEAA